MPEAGDTPHLLNPKSPHFLWHTDITEASVRWWRFEIAAALDGCSRELLGIRVFNRRVNTDDMSGLVHDATEQSGTTPRFLISDRGSLFREQFTNACEDRESIMFAARFAYGSSM